MIHRKSIEKVVGLKEIRRNNINQATVHPLIILKIIIIIFYKKGCFTGHSLILPFLLKVPFLILWLYCSFRVSSQRTGERGFR